MLENVSDITNIKHISISSKPNLKFKQSNNVQIIHYYDAKHFKKNDKNNKEKLKNACEKID